MADGINAENLFKNFSTKLNNLYKDKNVELSQSDMNNIFNAAIKNDADGKLDVNEFMKAAENYDVKKFGNVAEKTAEFEEFTEAFNDIGLLDGSEGFSADDMKKISEIPPEEISEFKSGAKIKTENNQNYVNVENWNSGNVKGNDCLERIIKNCYDLEALGIKPGSREYFALEKGVMDANENIYGENSGRKRLSEKQRNTTMLYGNDKITLPKISEIDDKNLQSKVIKSAQTAGKTYTVADPVQDYTSDSENPRTVKKTTVYNPDGSKTVRETTHFTNDDHTIIIEKNNDKNSVITSRYDNEGNLKQRSEITSKVSGDNPYRTITEKLTDENGIETEIVKYENLKTGKISVASDNTQQVKAKTLSYSDIEYRIEFISFQQPGPGQIKSLRDDVYYSSLSSDQKIQLNKYINKMEEAENKRLENRINGQTYGYSKPDINGNSNGTKSASFKDLEDTIEFMSFENPGADGIKDLRDRVYESGLPDNQKIQLQLEINKIEEYYNN